MNLKTLISLKFVLYVISFFGMSYFGGNITGSCKNLESQNKILLDQKKYYEEILKLDNSNSKGKEALHRIIEITDSQLKLEKKNNNGLSLTTNIWILVGSVLLISNLFTYINAKIDKLKSEETAAESENFL